MSVAGPASAEPLPLFYVAAAGGLVFSPLLKADNDTTHISTDLGPAGSLVVGAAAGNGVRVELEGLYASQSINAISRVTPFGNRTNFTGLAGRETTWALLANIAYDVPLPVATGVRPFVGVGVGVGALDFNNAGGTQTVEIGNLPGGSTYIGPATLTFGNSTTFAYQAFGGLAYKVPGTAGLELTVQDKLFCLANATIRNRAVGPSTFLFSGQVATGFRNLAFSQTSNLVMVGLRYSFNAAP